MSDPSDLAEQVKTHFDNRDYEALMRVVNQALGLSDVNLDTGAQLRGIQGQIEDEKLREEFEIHVANLKNEATKQFDQERYNDCLGTFRFLCELEPDNRTLRDYLELCQQLLPATAGSLPGEVTAKVPDAKGMVRNPTEVLVPSESFAEPPVSQVMSTGTTQAGVPNLQSSNNEEKSRLKPEEDTSLDVILPSGMEVSQPEPLTKGATAREVKEPAVKSLTFRLKFSFVAVSLLLVAILGVVYVKGPMQGWKSSHQHRPNSGNTPLPASPSNEGASQAERQALLLQKAEAAAASNHYVAPPGDNVVAYCNQVLTLDPQNTKARSAKEDSVNRALIQARKSVENRKFSEAHEIYSSLLTLSHQESHFPLTAQEVEKEIEKLEFTVYPVVHDHLFGSCKGYLRFNAYLMSFVPSRDSTDGFTEPFSEVTLFAPSDRLKIEIRAKTYHFESKTGDHVKSSAQIMTIYRDLKRRMAKEN
jgi:hypothetical protein